MDRSPNCDRYTDAASVLVEVVASAPGMPARTASASSPPAGQCLAKSLAFSCQTKAFEAPDATTERFLEDKGKAALADLGCATDNVSYSFRTNLIGSQTTEYSAERLANEGSASNCFQHNAGLATHVAEAVCHPMYDMTDKDGNRVRNVFKRFSADLAACDVSEDAMPQLMEDLRKVAALNAAKNGFTVDKVEDLACNYSVMPYF